MEKTEGLVGEQTQVEGVTEETQKKLYTEEELKEMLQSEADRRVTLALKNVESKWEQKVNELLSSKEKEIQQAKLAEEGKFKELFEQKQAELDALKAAADREKVRAETNELLAQKNLGPFADIFNKDLNDFDNRKSVIENLNTLVEDVVNQRVMEKLNTKAPAKGAKDDPTPKSLEERERIALKNRDLDELKRINIEKINYFSGRS